MTTTETVNPYPTNAPATSNPAGRAAFVAAIIIVVLGLVQQFIIPLAPMIMNDLALGTSGIGMVFGVFNAVVGVIALVGLILGIVGLNQRHAPRLLAAAGTAVCAASLLSVVFGLLFSVVVDVIY